MDVAASKVMMPSGNNINANMKVIPPSYSATYFNREAKGMNLSATDASIPEVEAAPSRRDLMSGMQKLFSWRHNPDDSTTTDGGDKHTLGVKDFDLLKVVGKGAFGKVMLVRKKSEPCKGNIFAMKVCRRKR